MNKKVKIALVTVAFAGLLYGGYIAYNRIFVKKDGAVNKTAKAERKIFIKNVK